MTRPELRALVFDVDGTLADTEEAHRIAFNRAFAETGLDWAWDVATYTRLLEVSGGKERMLHWWREGAGDGGASWDAAGKEGRAATVARLHARKTAFYEELVAAGAVRLRPGVAALLQAAPRAGLRLAIATTTSPANVAALLAASLGGDWPARIPIVEDAATAPRKKPDPQAYVQALARLGVAPGEALAFEDSSNGLRAARAAGIPTLVTPNGFTAHHDFSGALCLVPDLEGIGPELLRQWHSRA